ncbi:peptidyl-prolyl cis-trans isomerase SurA [Deferribacter desulfuricans SSM1]|uniref:Peptidyl-prolyl cis-trans isomerase SurA n=1 Tax=Deferribacter desulfuricans (strain DSM 14783 / JCM 11476 / NBRC 101012 / SSM1) TaxID=639282 RepID=D3PAW9_DEFDS|nr:SurA N-terminal domain-containing protein [Deferribacter desulfuricans]BAI79742.1 peptidyl-prolyl cis-trans isomerase SurA [Deferribacter desulfuricans SSM1]
MRKLPLILIILILLVTIAQSKIIDKVVAIVGDKIITQYDVESFNPKQVKKIYSIKDEATREKLLKKYYKEVLDFLVNQYVLEIAAEREGIKVSESEVENALNEVLTKNNITIEQLEKVLEENNLTLAKYKYQLKNEILNARIRNALILPKLVVTEEDIKHYIDEHNKELKLDDQFELRIIKIKDKNRLDEIEKFLKKGGSFADAAIKYSVDKTAKSGGYIGWIKLNHLPEKIREKVKGYKEGDIVKIEDNGEITLLFIENFKSKYDIDDKMKDEIVKKIKEKMYPDVVKNWLEKHKATIFIKYM